MSNTKKYLIKLTPIDKYFFGGETTFGAVGSSNYLVKSNYFPQQTGLLGMLRYELLLQNNLLSPGSGRKLDSRAIDLIGEKSFRVEPDNNFAVIHSLSPTYIVDDKGDFLMPNPYFISDDNKCSQFEIEFSNSDSKEEIIPSVFQCDDKGERIKKDNKNLYFDPKDELFNGFISKKSAVKYQYTPEVDEMGDFIFDDRKDHTDYKEYIFYPEEQIGIHKEGDDESFYKQTSMRMRKGFSMAFFAEIDVRDDYKFESNTIFMGGEQSAFKMDMEEFNSDLKFDFKPLIKNETELKIRTILLQSHSYISPKIYDNCIFAITETMDFRFLVSSVRETENYYRLDRKSKDERQLFKSEKFNLVKSGSLFFVKDANFDKVVEEIENPCFQQIGYNHYTEIKN